jgi:hypothetical protein
MTCIDLAYARSWVERRYCLFLHQQPLSPLGCLWIGLSRLSRIPASPKPQRLAKEAIGIRLLLSLALGNKPTLDQAPRSKFPAPTSGILLEEAASADLRGMGQSDEQLRSAAPISSSDQQLRSAATIPESSTLPRDPRVPRPLVDRTRTCLSGWLLRDGCQALCIRTASERPLDLPSAGTPADPRWLRQERNQRAAALTP